MGAVHFIFAFLAAGITIIAGSLLWPKITVNSRPKPLQEVRDVVVQTSAGKNVAEILGVADDLSVKPVNVSSAASAVVTNIITTIEKGSQEIVTRQVFEQLVRQIDQMPTEQKKQIQDAVCRP
ncbi:hypothetical protein HY948_00805 [Candidatus Gottesmanbacteria bacterium]|nr:hypothetical protein [Candidatus Gottesmanbacteria bacterium]